MQTLLIHPLQRRLWQFMISPFVVLFHHVITGDIKILCTSIKGYPLKRRYMSLPNTTLRHIQNSLEWYDFRLTNPGSMRSSHGEYDIPAHVLFKPIITEWYEIHSRYRRNGRAEWERWRAIKLRRSRGESSPESVADSESTV